MLRILAITALTVIGVVFGGAAAASASPAVDTVTSTSTVQSPWGLAVTPDGHKLYVASAQSNSVSVIDTSSRTQVGAPIPVGHNPYGVSVSPDGSKVYVTNAADGTVSVISTLSGTVVATIIINGGTGTPLYSVFSPDGTKAYVTLNTSDTVVRINVATNIVDYTYSVGTAPLGITISPDGSKVFVVNNGDGSLSVIQTSSNSVNTSARIADYPTQVAISRDGGKLFITEDYGLGLVFVYDTLTNALLRTISVGTQESTSGVQVSNDGDTLYVGIASPVNPCIAVFDIPSLTLLECISAALAPTVLSIGPSSSTLFSSAVDSNLINVVTFIAPPTPSPSPTQSASPSPRTEPALASTGFDANELIFTGAGFLSLGFAFKLASTIRRRNS